MADTDQRTGSRNIGGGVVLQSEIDSRQFGTKWRAIKKADPLEVDPTTKQNNIMM